jgi:DNA invertase Pin-like site-specific DNA recombinase
MSVLCVIYAAKSTEDKHGSIPTQFEDCRAMAEHEDWKVMDEFSDEAFSAYHGNRGPGLARAKQRAIELAGEHGRCVLVAQDADRFARGAGDAPGAADHLTEVYFALRRQGVELWTVRSRQLDLLRAAMEGERAHDETARKAQAVKAGIKRQRATGKAWGEPPLGYLIEKQVVDGEVIAKRVIDAERRQIVNVIFDALDKGASTGAVARKLNQTYRTRRGKQFKARTVRAIAENRDYLGTTAYPQIIDQRLWQRVNDKIKRLDQAAVQNRRCGRQPLADFMLRRLVFCGECGEPMYSLMRHGKRIYHCAAQAQRRGTCSSLKVSADIAEERILEHLELFIGDVGGWIEDQLAEASGEQKARQASVDAAKTQLAVLDRQREKLMAEYERLVAEDDPLARYALEPVAKLDQERQRQEQAITDTEALLSEWTDEPDTDRVLDFYNRVVDLVRGRVAHATGIAEINEALHDALTGVWLRYDGQTLMAEIKLRVIEWDENFVEDFECAAAEVFGPTWKMLPPEPEMIEYRQRELCDSAGRCWSPPNCNARAAAG